jgi:steroid delta-isomerase-like uncharacterized protein
MTKHSLLVAFAVLALVACAAPPPPDYAAQHKPALDTFVAAWNGAGLDTLDAVVAPDFKRHAPSMDAEGLDGIKKLMTELRTAYPDAKVVVDESHFTKDVSFALWTFTGTNTGPGALPPTGKSVKLSGASLARFQDGKIAEELVFFDQLDWQMQLGYTLTPPADAGAAR